MKKNLFLWIFAFAVFITSCKKESTITTEPIKYKLLKTSHLPGQGSGEGNFVYEDESGNFYTHFGKGIGYGSFFPHPLSATASDFGQSWIPGAGGLDNMGTNMNDYYENDDYFVVSYLKASNYGVNSSAMAAYYNAFNTYVSGSSSQPYLPSINDYIPDASSTLDVFVGRYIIDPASPTNVSIVGVN